MWCSTPAPATRPWLKPTLNPCGSYFALQDRDRLLRERHHLGRRLGRDVLDAAYVLERGDHQVPVRVRVEVEDHEAVLAAVDDQVRDVVILRGLRAEDALLLEVL